MAEIIGFAIVTIAAFYIARPLLERRSDFHVTARAGDEVADLLSRRDTLYRELADLDFDHRLGKVDEEDYVEQKQDLLDEAALVLQRLDAAPAELAAAGASLTDRRLAEIEAEVLRRRGRGDWT